jgi:hypothetical protein
LSHPIRSFSRGAVEVLVARHSEDHPHNSPMPHGYHDQLQASWHADQESEEPVRFAQARMHRSPDGSHSSGSGVVAVGCNTKLRRRNKRLAEIVTELSLRCSLTRAQQCSVSAMLTPFSNSNLTTINFNLFVEIAKCCGVAEGQMGVMKQLFQAYDADGDAKLGVEELCDGLAFCTTNSLRDKLRLLYTTWSGAHQTDPSCSHGGHNQSGLSKFDVWSLLATLAGADYTTATDMRTLCGERAELGEDSALGEDGAETEEVTVEQTAAERGDIEEGGAASPKKEDIQLAKLNKSLFVAVLDEDVSRIAMLLERGADPLAKDADGRTYVTTL